MHSGLVSAAALVAAVQWAGTATAAPISGGTPAPATQPLVSKVATFVCLRDDRGWHYMRGHRRVICRPVRPMGAYWGWHCEGRRCGWWHRHAPRFYD